MTIRGTIRPIVLRTADAVRFVEWFAATEPLTRETAAATRSFMESERGILFARFTEKLARVLGRAVRHRRASVTLRDVTREEAGAAFAFLGLRCIARATTDPPEEQTHRAGLRVWFALLPALRRKGRPQRALADAQARLDAYADTDPVDRPDLFSGSDIRVARERARDLDVIAPAVAVMRRAYMEAGVPDALQFSDRDLEQLLTRWIDRFADAEMPD